MLVPQALLLAMAGLALVGALVGALKEIAKGPLILGPIFAFAIALSDMTLLGLGPFFWSLVLGAAISLMLERDGWKRLRVEAAESMTQGSSGKWPGHGHSVSWMRTSRVPRTVRAWIERPGASRRSSPKGG